MTREKLSLSIIVCQSSPVPQNLWNHTVFLFGKQNIFFKEKKFFSRYFVFWASWDAFGSVSCNDQKIPCIICNFLMYLNFSEFWQEMQGKKRERFFLKLEWVNFNFHFFKYALNAFKSSGKLSELKKKDPSQRKHKNTCFCSMGKAVSTLLDASKKKSFKICV